MAICTKEFVDHLNIGRKEFTISVKDVMKALAIMVSGGKITSRLSVFNSPEMNDNKKEIQEVKIKKAAEKFAKSLSKRSVSKPPFSYLIWFSAFKASSVINREGLPAERTKCWKKF